VKWEISLLNHRSTLLSCATLCALLQNFFDLAARAEEVTDESGAVQLFSNVSPTPASHCCLRYVIAFILLAVAVRCIVEHTLEEAEEEEEASFAIGWGDVKVS